MRCMGIWELACEGGRLGGVEGTGLMRLLQVHGIAGRLPWQPGSVGK